MRARATLRWQAGFGKASVFELGGQSFVQPGFAAAFAEGAFVGLHGIWNRDAPVDFVTGFQVDGKAMGRPVGVTVDPKSALIVADDLSDTVGRVTPTR